MAAALTSLTYPDCANLAGNGDFPCNASSIIAVSLGLAGGAVSLLFVLFYLIRQVRTLVLLPLFPCTESGKDFKWQEIGLESNL